jgi:hypothetical protein
VHRWRDGREEEAEGETSRITRGTEHRVDGQTELRYNGDKQDNGKNRT